MRRWILHVDVDAFFASVEQALNPALAGRPVIVGGDGEQRTVVASCSYEARARGVRTAMRTREARRLCPEAVFLPGDRHVYEQAARAVFKRLRKLSPKVRPVSLDEAYVELPRTPGTSPLEIACDLCREVKRSLRLPLSVGIGTSLLVAKLATRLAKPAGCFLLFPEYERTFLSGLPVEWLPGVGRRTAEMLHGFSIHRVRDLLAVPRDILVRTFGRRGEQLHAFARGRDDRPVEVPARPTSVSRETSFEEPARTHGVLLAMASYLLDRAMKEVLSHGLAARTLGVHLRYVDGHPVSRSRTLPAPARHEAHLIPILDTILRRLFTRRVPVHLVGITLSSLQPIPDRQHSLFTDAEDSRRDRLASTLDRIRARHGFGAVIQGPAIDLVDLLPHDPRGFRLRIPSLTR